MADRELQRVQTLAKVLDTYFVDPLLGLLLPGAGDLAGSLLGLYAVSLAIRRRMSPVVIARMLLNLSIDALLGAVPLLGDLFDFGFRAHERNVRLLALRGETGGRATPRDWLMVAGAAVVFAGSLALAAYALVALLRLLARAASAV
jgi:uncharacterized protein DUF4112